MKNLIKRLRRKKNIIPLKKEYVWGLVSDNGKISTIFEIYLEFGFPIEYDSFKDSYPTKEAALEVLRQDIRKDDIPSEFKFVLLEQYSG